MNRSTYFSLIEEKLNFLAFRLESRGSLNILDLHLHAQSFYLHFFNLLFGWDLKDLNTADPNAPAIDLIDSKNRIVIQVSATATKQKIESALTKEYLAQYKGYSFKFISISKNAKGLRANTFVNPHELVFLPADDIFDNSSILKLILEMNTDKQKEIYEFLKKELKSEPDPEKIESNLTTIIKILSKEDWSHGVENSEITPYDIEAKISYNQLDTARVLIDDYKIHYNRIDKIYSSFDKQGVNKSSSILNGIRMEYLSLGPAISPDQCFFSIIEKITQKIRTSANYTSIPDEELSQCVQILVVDSFIRCKIFKNPAGGTDAGS